MNCFRCPRLDGRGCGWAITLRSFGRWGLLGTTLEALAIGARWARWHLRARRPMIVSWRALERRAGLTAGLKALGPWVHFIAAEFARSWTESAAIELPAVPRIFELLAAPIALGRPEFRVPVLGSGTARFAAIFSRALGRPSTVGVHARTHGPAVLGVTVGAWRPIFPRRPRSWATISRLGMMLHNTGFAARPLRLEVMVMMARLPHLRTAEASPGAEATALGEAVAAIRAAMLEVRRQLGVLPHLRSATLGRTWAEVTAPWLTLGEAVATIRAAMLEVGRLWMVLPHLGSATLWRLRAEAAALGEARTTIRAWLLELRLGTWWLP